MADKKTKRLIAVLGARFGDLKIEEELLRPFDVDLVEGSGLDEEETARLCSSSSIILAGGVPKLPASLIGRLPQLKAIVRYGIGVDTVDLDEATRRGIYVANVPDYCIDEVATHALALVLACARKLPLAERITRSGRWEVAPLMPMQSLRDLVLGVVGFGRIAHRLARMARSLGLEVAASDPYVKKSAIEKAGVRPLAFDRLLSTADFISLHLPLVNETRHILNDQTIGRMKPTAYIINTARGGLIDEAALDRALREKRIAGAALDVMEEEPWPAGSPLRELDNLIVTPHAAWYTVRAQRELRVKACQEVIRVLSGKPPKNLVNRGLLR
jgi:D-3-phosphoglycerate dehydrogenase